jgi:uncharacterized protein (TIGR01319 family)
VARDRARGRCSLRGLTLGGAIPVVAEVDVEPGALDTHFDDPVVLADFGSTYTKVTIVDAASGELIARASHPTTVETDVLDGFDAGLARVAETLPHVALDRVLACSSAAGGLRLGVIGLEKDLTAEAGRRTALSAGARVVTVVDGGLADDGVAPLMSELPDILLLTGGVDGGNRACLVDSATAIASSGILTPIVIAGNIEAGSEALRILQDDRRRQAVAIANVMPEIGTINAEPARQVIRELFIKHVIGGKELSSRPEFASMVCMPTPEAVLLATELLGARHGPRDFGDVAVIDVGGATTDVHSFQGLSEAGGYVRNVLPSSGISRTVEGDLGLRWNAPGIVEAARAETGIDADTAERLDGVAERLQADPSWVPSDDWEADDDAALATLAARIALQRHAGELRDTLTSDGAALRKTGKDLRTVRTMIGTGGIFAHAAPAQLETILSIPEVSEAGTTRLLPRRPSLMVDRRYVMAAAGLLSVAHPNAAARLLRDQILEVEPVGERMSHGR